MQEEGEENQSDTDNESSDNELEEDDNTSDDQTVEGENESEIIDDSAKEITVSATLKTEIDTTTGKVTAKFETSTLADILSQTTEIQKTGQKPEVEISVETQPDAKTVEVEFSKDIFDTVAKDTNADIKIEAGLGTIKFSNEAIKSISNSATSDNISISIAKIETTVFTKEIQEKIGDRPVFDFTVNSGESQISTFGGQNVEISIPYSPKSDENVNSIVIYYINDQGELEVVRGKYDAATGKVNFKTNNFSKLFVGNNEILFKNLIKII